MKKVSSVKILVLAACLAAVLTAVSPVSLQVYADAKDEVKKGVEISGGGNSNAGQNLPDMITTVINVMLFIVGVLAVIMIIYGGIRFITAHGDEKQVANARQVIIYSVVGLIVAIAAYAIVSFVFDRFK